MTVADPSLRFEAELFSLGATAVLGCDEVGRGALAGPVFVGACAVLPGVQRFPAGLRDSKMLSERCREALIPELRSWSAAWAVGERRPDQIDRDGIVQCLSQSAVDAVRAVLLALPASAVARVAVVLDGSQDWLSPVLQDARVRVFHRPKADRDCASVSAASVLAKVSRDHLMVRGAQTWPGYAWERNKGYGAAAHRQALAAHGPTPWHRKTWLHLDAPARSGTWKNRN